MTVDSPSRPTRTSAGVFVAVLAALALMLGLLSPAQAATGITGRIVAAANGAPVVSVGVSLERQVVEDGETYWDNYDYDQTDGNGTYSFGSSPAGTYRVTVRPDYNDTIGYTNGSSPAFPVGETGAVVVPDTLLVIGGTVTGTVTRTDGTGQGIRVAALMLGEYGWSEVKSIYTSDLSGAYSLGGLPAGNVRLEFEDAYSTHLAEYWDDKPTVEAATDIPVTLGGTTPNRDAVLAVGGTISGKVTAEVGGANLQNIGVVAYRKVVNGAQVRWEYEGTGGSTAADGTYTVKGLPTGTYHLEFRDNYDPYYNNRPVAYDGEFWDNKPAQESAVDIPVTAGQPVQGKNAALAVRGKITGTVTKGTGGPLENGEVALYRYYQFEEGDGYWQGVATVFTNAAGQYELPNVSAGSYHLEFRDESGVYLSEFFEDAATQETARAVTVSSRATTSVNASLQLGGKITGTVSAPGGAHPETCVRVYREDVVDGTSRYQRTYDDAVTLADGTYTVDGLPTGTYKLRFSTCEGSELATEFYDDATTLSSATPIPVTAGATASGKDVALEDAATISGTVAGVGEDDVERRVNIVSATTGEVVARTNVEEGTYSVTGLRAGSYKVEFARLSGIATKAAQFYNGKAEHLGLGQANTLSVIAGQIMSGVNASLATGGHVTGRVVDAAGVPFADLQVHAYTDDRSLVTRAAFTAADGTFDIGGLTTGSYKIVANLGERRNLAPGYFTGQSNLSGSPTSATPVTVTLGSTKAIAGNLVLDATPALENSVLPTISSQSPQVGVGLTAAPGTWTPAAGTSYAYEWLRGASSSAIGSGQSYTPTSGDLGSPLRVRVTATKPSGQQLSRTSAPTGAVSAAPVAGPPAPPAAGPPAIVKVNPTIKVVGKGAKKKATLTITVRAPGVIPTGRITIKLGNKKLKTVTLKGGKAKVVLTKQKKGKKAYKVSYAGDNRVNAKTVTSKKIPIR